MTPSGSAPENLAAKGRNPIVQHLVAGRLGRSWEGIIAVAAAATSVSASSWGGSEDDNGDGDEAGDKAT